MLIKEYRIPLPLTVEEYRIAQLYMIAKKSREESSGAGSGVEIIINEPYKNGPGGEGQYTKKIYHVGSHLPGWLKGILPKTALMVEEEAWNAYPYTKTRYTCPFVEKFSLEIETYYYPDNGHQDNVFNLNGNDLRNRIVDIIDFVKDQCYGNDYIKEEDPIYYISKKTGRGPMTENWLNEYWNEVKGKLQPLENGKALMCAYKLCKVEFRYWGMQTKIERFIHDVALRKTMLRAHRQAWAWQDEWHGLTMDDIREIERQTQLALKRKMGQIDDDDEIDEDDNLNNSSKEDSGKSISVTLGSIEVSENSPLLTKNINKISNIQINDEQNISDENEDDKLTKYEEKCKINRDLHSPSLSSIKSFDLQVANWRIESLRRDSNSDCSDDEYFDCENVSLAKWSSLNLLNDDNEEECCETISPKVIVNDNNNDSIFSATFLKRVASERNFKTFNSIDSPNHLKSCSTSVLLLVFHAGSVLDPNVDIAAKKSDLITFKSAFETVIRQHYTSLVGHIAIRLVSCPSICTESLGILSSLSPYSFDVSPSCVDVPQVTHDSIPIGAIPILATSNSDYLENVSRTINTANNVYQEFLKSEDGKGFTGQVSIVSDSIGSILAYDALCRSIKYQSRHGSENSILDNDYLNKADDIQINEKGYLTASPSHRRRSSSTNDNQIKFEFEVGDFFMFGSPLALVLAYRKVSTLDEKSCNIINRPNCIQVYNLFHPTDPVAARLEPLLSARFSILPPINIPRYAKYPLGNGQPYHLLEIFQTNPQMFNDSGYENRRLSEVSIQSTISGLIDNIPLQTISALQNKWWGPKRLDYALYCPEGLLNFPTNALPHLFHSSYWESTDVIAFILRQIGGIEIDQLESNQIEENKNDDNNKGDYGLLFFKGIVDEREKWIKKRTSVKVKNITANHRANDIIVKEGEPQILTARFMYGPLDMVALTGEKVDIYIMKDGPIGGEWTLISTEITDKNGRITYIISKDKTLNYGLYPIKMIVCGDNTYVDFFMAVIPPKTECIVFSIDGSFTASVSVSGKDPKVRAGAVDVVRHWQELGYLIIYITGRPDMQHKKVVSWLIKHNFPHGFLSFADGLSTDPLGHKAACLNNLIKNHDVLIHSAYGSSKDISVYISIGLKQKQIFIVGKASKKQHQQATILTDGYIAHLSSLIAHGGSRPAQGNARMVIPRGYFTLPGQNFSRRRSRSAKRATSYPIATDVTTLERSLSSRRYQLAKTTLSTFGNQ